MTEKISNDNCLSKIAEALILFIMFVLVLGAIIFHGCRSSEKQQSSYNDNRGSSVIKEDSTTTKNDTTWLNMTY